MCAIAKMALNDREILFYVRPFCISGCLALDEQHGIFRSLVSAAEITKIDCRGMFGGIKDHGRVLGDKEVFAMQF